MLIKTGKDYEAATYKTAGDFWDAVAHKESARRIIATGNWRIRHQGNTR